MTHSFVAQAPASSPQPLLVPILMEMWLQLVTIMEMFRIMAMTQVFVKKPPWPNVATMVHVTLQRTLTATTMVQATPPSVVWRCLIVLNATLVPLYPAVFRGKFVKSMTSRLGVLPLVPTKSPTAMHALATKTTLTIGRYRGPLGYRALVHNIKTNF